MTHAFKSLSTGQEGTKMPDETKEVFDQDVPDRRGEVPGTTESIDPLIVEMGNGVGEIHTDVVTKEATEINFLRQDLNQPSVSSKGEMKAQISTEEEVSQSQISANRERAKSKEGLMIKLSRTKIGKPFFAFATIVLATVGIGGSIKSAEHLRNSDVAAEKADYGRDKTAMDTEINNMLSQLQNPNLAEDERASLEEHINETKKMRDNLVGRHKEYVNKYGDERTVEVADGTQYQDSTENKSE